MRHEIIQACSLCKKGHFVGTDDVVTLAFEATFCCQDSGLKWTARKSDFEAIHGIYWECKMIPDKLATTYTVILENANNAGFLSNLCLELTKIYRT